MILPLVILLSSIASNVFLSYLIFRRKTQQKNVIQYPKVIFVEGIICTMISIISLYILILIHEYAPIIVVIIPFGIGIYLILKSFVWKIEYEKESFVFRNIIGLKRAYSYRDIIKVVIKKEKYYTLVFNRNKITVDMMATNSENFLNVIKRNIASTIMEKK